MAVVFIVGESVATIIGAAVGPYFILKGNGCSLTSSNNRVK